MYIVLVCIGIHLLLTHMNCSLPFPIALEIFVQEYNSFIEKYKPKSRYKLEYQKGTVYIVNMCSSEHRAGVNSLSQSFYAYNSTYSLYNALIQVHNMSYKRIFSYLLI